MSFKAKLQETQRKCEGNTKEVNKKIKRWSLMNTYNELIWAKYINKFNKNFLNEAYLKLLASKIKQQKL